MRLFKTFILLATQKQIINTIKATITLISDNNFTPLFTPDTADKIKTKLIIKIIPICTFMLSGIPNKYSKPLFICNTPRPNEVTTPAIVAKIARPSIMPLINFFFTFMVSLIKDFFFFLN